MRTMLSDLPDGEGYFEDFCDGDGIPDSPDGKDAPFWIRMRVTKTGDRVKVDFAGSDPQVKGPINAPLSVSASGVYCGLKTAVDPNSLIPPNSGCWRTIEVKAPKGSVVNAEFPAPVVYANHEISHRVADMVMGALANFWPTQVMACSQGTSAILTLGGLDPRSGRRYVSYETIKGGFGARPNKDGIHVVASGISNTMNTPIEVLEMAFPVRMERYEINPDFGRGRAVSGRLRGTPRVAHAGGRRRHRRAVHGAHDLAAVRPARRQSGIAGRGYTRDARRRLHAICRARAPSVHPRARSSTWWCRAPAASARSRSAILPLSAATCSKAMSANVQRGKTMASPIRNP